MSFDDLKGMAAASEEWSHPFSWFFLTRGLNLDHASDGLQYLLRNSARNRADIDSQAGKSAIIAEQKSLGLH